MIKIEAHLCNELECVYNDMTNKVVEKKCKLTNEDVIEFQKKLQDVYDTNAAIREKVIGIKDSKKWVQSSNYFTKETYEKLIRLFGVIKR